jgi:hypothetical protein
MENGIAAQLKNGAPHKVAEGRGLIDVAPCLPTVGSGLALN